MGSSPIGAREGCLRDEEPSAGGLFGGKISRLGCLFQETDIGNKLKMLHFCPYPKMPLFAPHLISRLVVEQVLSE